MKEREKLRRLHEVNLDDSIRTSLYASEFDEPRTEVVASDKDVQGEMELLTEKANNIPGANETLKANFIAMALNKSGGNMSRVEIREVKDTTDQLKVSHFKPNMQIATGNTIGDILGTTFAEYPFGDELQKAEMEYLLIDYAIKVVTARHIEIPSALPESRQQYNTAVNLKKTQLDLLFARLETLELIRLRKDRDTKIVRKSKTESLRSNTIAANRHGQMVSVPVFGTRNNLQSDVFKKLLGNMHGVTFGSEKATQELKSYLEIVKSVTENEYNERATYLALMHVLSQEPRQFVENCFEDHCPLDWTWMQLQVGWGRSISKANYPILIKEALQTRPDNIAQNLLKIAGLIRCKNKGMEHEDRVVLNDIEIEKYLLNYMQTWYPYHISQIEHRFKAIKLEKKAIGGMQPPHDHTLSTLADSIIGDVQPIRLNFEQRKGRPFVHAMEVDLAVQEDRILRLDLEDSSDATVNAFSGGNVNKVGNFGNPNRARAGGFIIPSDFRNRCLKCGSNEHFMKECPKYRERIQSHPCEYCQCYHTEKCLNIANSKIHEMTTPKDPFEKISRTDQSQ